MLTHKNVSRRNFIKLSGIAATGLGLAACGNVGEGSDDAVPEGVIRLGGIGPITGPLAIYGKATKYGAQVAVEEVNALGDPVFALKWEDDEHDPDKAVNAYNTLKNWGMQILIGTTTTTPCVAVAAESNTDRIFELTPSASSTDVIGGQEDENGNVTIPRKDNVFQMCLADPNQGTASAKYIAKQKLGTKIAVIYNNADPYSTGIYRKFKAEAKKLGLSIVSTTEFTDDSATDFSVQVGDAKSAGADLLFLPTYCTPASLIIAEAKKQNYTDVQFFGVDGMDGILALKGFDTSLAEGVMLLTPFVATAEDERTQAFVEAYKKAAKTKEAPNQFAADAYDCVWAIYEALQDAKALDSAQSASEICEALINEFASGKFSYDGITGVNMTWSDTGEVSKDPNVAIIVDGKYQLLDK